MDYSTTTPASKVGHTPASKYDAAGSGKVPYWRQKPHESTAAAADRDDEELHPAVRNSPTDPRRKPVQVTNSSAWYGGTTPVEKRIDRPYRGT